MKQDALIKGKCFKRNFHLDRTIPQRLRCDQTAPDASNPPFGGNTAPTRGIIIAMMVSLSCLALSSLAVAGTFAVTSTLDSGPGSLRDAIEDASQNTEADLIEFDLLLAGQTISLNQSLIISDDDLTFDGSRASGLRPHDQCKFQQSREHLDSFDKISLTRACRKEFKIAW